MIDPPIHIVLFAVVVLVIVTVHAFYSSPSDAAALRAVPFRFAKFFFWCAVVAGLMLAAEHTLASVH